MSLALIKQELVTLCRDVQNSSDLPPDYEDRIRAIRKRLMQKDGWTEKTGHLQLLALTALWIALAPNATYGEVQWQINRADGAIDTAITAINEEWMHGIPKPLKPALSPDEELEETTDAWIDSHLDDGEFISNQDLYQTYQEFMHSEELNPLSSVAFGKRLKAVEFQSAMRKISGKTVRGWMISVKE